MANTTIAPEYLTIDELFNTFPTLQERGWTAELIETLVENDVIAGVLKNEIQKNTVVNRLSMITFLEYHNAFLLNRVNAVEANIEMMKENDRIKKAVQKKK